MSIIPGTLSISISLKTLPIRPEHQTLNLHLNPKPTPKNLNPSSGLSLLRVSGFRGFSLNPKQSTTI